MLELEPAAAPATVLESEGTGRERRARGFYFGDSGHGSKVGSGHVAAMAAAYELAGGGQRKGRWLGKAEGAVEMLGSCLRWCGLPTGGDRQAAAAVGRERRESSIQGGREAVSGGAGTARRVEGGDGGQLGLAFYRPKKRQQLAASTTAINGGDCGRASACGRRRAEWWR